MTQDYQALQINNSAQLKTQEDDPEPDLKDDAPDDPAALATPSLIVRDSER